MKLSPQSPPKRPHQVRLSGLKANTDVAFPNCSHLTKASTVISMLPGTPPGKSKRLLVPVRCSTRFSETLESLISAPTPGFTTGFGDEPLPTGPASEAI